MITFANDSKIEILQSIYELIVFLVIYQMCCYMLLYDITYDNKNENILFGVTGPFLHYLKTNFRVCSFHEITTEQEHWLPVTT